VAELLARDEDDRIAIEGLQPGNRALKPDDVVKVATVEAAVQSGDDRQLLSEAEEGPAAASEIAARIEHDAAQPSGELRLAAEVSELFDQGAADILRDVVGIRPRAGHLPGKSVNPIIVTPEQGFESLAITGHGGGEQISIRIIVGWRHRILFARSMAVTLPIGRRSLAPSR
jgi:hypothetical protein